MTQRDDDDRAGWAGVFDADEPILWSGAPSLLRRLATDLVIALVALAFARASLPHGGVWATVAMLIAFFFVRRFWLHGLGISTVRYAITTRSIAVWRTGSRSGWQKYPLLDYFLQEDLGVLRVFHRPYGPPMDHFPQARLVCLARAARGAAVLAANGVQRQHFHISARHTREPMEQLVLRVLASAGVAEDEPQLLSWQGQPQSPMRAIPLMLGAIAAMLLVTFALIAAIKGDASQAVGLGVLAVLGAAAEVSWFRWQARRTAWARYAIAGRYAIRIGRGVPLLTLACDVYRIGPTARIQPEAHGVAYAPVATWCKHWFVGQIAFHDPTGLGKVTELLRALAKVAPESQPADQGLTRASSTAQDTADRAEARS